MAENVLGYHRTKAGNHFSESFNAMSYLPLNRTWYNPINGYNCYKLYIVDNIETNEEMNQIREFEIAPRKRTI